MMEKLELSHEMEAAERGKLEQEIRAKQEEIQRIQSEVVAKDAEARRLEEVFEAAKCVIRLFSVEYLKESYIFILHIKLAAQIKARRS